MYSKLFWKKTSASNEYGVNSDGIDNRPHSTLKWYTRTKLGSLLPFFRKTIVIIPYLSDVPIFSFPWAYWFSFHTGIEQSIDMHALHHSEIFSGEEKVMRWTLLPKVFWSEARHAPTRRSSAPLRDATPDSALRYQRYIHSITWPFFHTINQMMSVWMFVHKNIQNSVRWWTVLPDDSRQKNREFV